MYFVCVRTVSININSETTKTIKSVHEINNVVLLKMGFVKTRNKWVSKDGVGAHTQDEVGHNTTKPKQETKYQNIALVPYVPPVNHGMPLSPSQKLLLTKIGTMDVDQKDHYEFCVARFNI